MPGNWFRVISSWFIAQYSHSSQKGFTHIFLILFLLIAVGAGVFLVSRQTNLAPKAGGGSVINFVEVDSNGSYKVITTTTTPNVKVLINAPYPPALGPEASSSAPPPSIYPEPDVEGEVSSSPEPEVVSCYAEKNKEVKCPPGNNENPNKKKTNEVLIEGRLSESIDLNVSRPEGDQSRHFIKIYLVNLCDPNEDGFEDYASLDPSGYFSYLVPKGSKFCVRPPEIKGYDFPPTATNTKGASYEDQIAGIDCAKRNYRERGCRGVANTKLDLAVDNTFNFTYKKTPAPVATTEVQLSEDPNFSSPYTGITYIKEEMIIDYTFKNTNLGKKVLYARFQQNDGSIVNANAPAVIELVKPSPSPKPSPTARFIKLTYPNGGETFNVGDNVRVTWQYYDVDNCSLGYSFGPGSLNWIKFSGINPSQRYYDWVVHIGNQLSGSSRQVKLDMTCYKTGVGSVIDQSDNFFTVTKP